MFTVRSSAVLVALSLALVLPVSAQVEWRSLTTAPSPSPRTKHAMEYAPGSQHVVLFGGIGAANNVLEDTWVWNGVAWSLATPAMEPAGRYLHAMTYDAARDRVVLFGGFDGTSRLADTWEWDGSGWSQLAATGPAARDHTAMSHDASSGATVLFGGSDGQTVLGDTWLLGPAGWVQATPPGALPLPRDGHAMAADAARGHIVMFGGGRSQGPLGDTWIFDASAGTWTLAAPDVSPPARFNHRMVWDPIRERVVLFGGRDGTRSFGDVWEWDGATWLERIPSGTGPTPRQHAGAAFDLTRYRTLVFGGDLDDPAGAGAFGDTYDYGATMVGSFTTFGTGCNTAPGAPPATMTGNRPWLGDTFTVDFAGFPPVSLTYLFIGFTIKSAPFAALPLELLPGCFLRIDPAIILQIPNLAGLARWHVDIPSSLPSVVGFAFYLQGFALGPTAHAITEGGMAVVGER